MQSLDVPVIQTAGNGMRNAPIHILQTCFSSSWGGLEMQALEVSRQMKRRGHEVWIACPYPSRLEKECNGNNIPVVRLLPSRYLNPSNILRLNHFIREEQIEIIHCHMSKDLATVVPAMKLSRRVTPVVLSKRMGSGISKRDIFHRFIYANVNCVFAVSESVNRNVLDTTPMLPSRVITIHDAIDTERFSLDAVDRWAVRKELGIAEHTVLIGFVGRFSPGKGHEEFLAAADVLRQKYPNTYFLIVGEASYGQEEYFYAIRALCTSLGLDTVVTFAGFRSDIPEVMAAFDIFAFPSHAESFGVALIEAMAMERPVVSSKCDGTLDILVDSRTGIFVQPKDASGLVSALERLIEDRPLRDSMGKEGRRRVEQHFDQKKQTKQMEEIYRQLLGANTIQLRTE